MTRFAISTFVDTSDYPSSTEVFIGSRQDADKSADRLREQIKARGWALKVIVTPLDDGSKTS